MRAGGATLLAVVVFAIAWAVLGLRVAVSVVTAPAGALLIIWMLDHREEGPQ